MFRYFLVYDEPQSLRGFLTTLPPLDATLLLMPQLAQQQPLSSDDAASVASYVIACVASCWPAHSRSLPRTPSALLLENDGRDDDGALPKTPEGILAYNANVFEGAATRDLPSVKSEVCGTTGAHAVLYAWLNPLCALPPPPPPPQAAALRIITGLAEGLHDIMLDASTANHLHSVLHAFATPGGTLP